VAPRAAGAAETVVGGVVAAAARAAPRNDVRSGGRRAQFLHFVKQQGELFLVARLGELIVLLGELAHTKLEVKVAQVVVDNFAALLEKLEVALHRRLHADGLGRKPEDIEQGRQGQGGAGKDNHSGYSSSRFISFSRLVR
jgi:hypothetical protein